MVLREHKYTIENVIKDVKEVETPPPDPTNEKFYDARKVIPEKFGATRRYVIILKRFYKMPTKRHRRALTYYEDSFTGKEAADYLDQHLPKCFDPKNCTRESCIKLLQQFMNENYFYNVRDSKNRMFKDDASLYKFRKDVIERKMNHFGTMGRPSSLDGILDLVSKNANIGHLRVYKSPIDAPYVLTTNLARRKSFSSGNLSNIAKFAQENEGPKYKPRRSSESSPSKLPVRKSASQTSQLKRSIQSSSKLEKVVEKCEDLPLPSPRVPPIPLINNKSYQVILKSQENPNISHEYEKPKIRRSNEHLLGLRPRSISGTMLNSRIEAHVKLRKPLGAVENLSNLTINTEVDEYKIWKFCLVEKLKNLIGQPSIDPLFIEVIDGIDIKWNCEMINEQGFVKLRSNADELSDHMRKMLRYLSKYPFDDQSIMPEMVYKGLELNTFHTLCQQFAAMAPLIPQIHAELLSAIVEHYQNESIKTLSHFSSSTTPSSMKILPSLTSGMTSSMERSSDLPLSSTTSQSSTTPLSSVSGGSKLGKGYNGSFDSSDASSFPKARGGNYGSFRAIPSKIVPTHSFLRAVNSYHSPEPLAYIDEQSSHSTGPYTSSPITTSTSNSTQGPAHPSDPMFGRTFSTIGRTFSTNSSTPSSMLLFSKNIPSNSLERTRRTSNSRRSGSSSGSVDLVTPYGRSRVKMNPLIETIDPDLTTSFILAVKLCLLTLKPSVRRRVHKLFVYLKRISENHCLILDEKMENRYVIIERVSQCFIEPNEKISVVMSPLLFAFLLDSHEQLFTVPQEMYGMVDGELNKLLEKKCTISERRRSSQTPPAPTPFCERIDRKTYDEASRDTDSHLLQLLDAIVEDKSLTAEERRKKLKQFKKCYPHLYDIRFPPTTAQNGPKSNARPTLISRFRSFI